MFIAGVFLALSALAREAFLLLIPVLCAYLWFSKKRKSIISLLIPVFLILAVFYLPSFFSKDGGNAYLNLFFEENKEERQFTDFNIYGHLYPDAYVYHFERKEFLDDYREKLGRAGFLQSLQMKKVLANRGESGIGILDRFFLGTVLLAGHLSRFVSLESVGGPFVLFFAVLGLLYLKSKNNWLYKFSNWWLIGTLFLLSFAVLVSRDHLRDFNWLVPFLVALGILFLSELFEKKSILFFFLSFVLLYNFVLADHVVFGKIYDSSPALKMESYAQEVKNRDIQDKDVIALGLNSKEQLILNYLADKSTVVLAPDTIKKLIEDEKLAEAFEFFNVKYILGYGDDLSSRILSQAEVSNIASDSIKINPPQTSPFQSFFMGLVR